MHYVLHEIGTGELIEISEEPFTADKMKLGLAVEFFDKEVPNLNEYHWNPKYLMWRKK